MLRTNGHSAKMYTFTIFRNKFSQCQKLNNEVRRELLKLITRHVETKEEPHVNVFDNLRFVKRFYVKFIKFLVSDTCICQKMQMSADGPPTGSLKTYKCTTLLLIIM